MNEQLRITRIVAATDLEECSTKALEHARILAERFAAEIVMVHAVPAYATAEPFPVTPMYYREDPALEQNAAVVVLDEYRRRHLPDRASASVVEVGDPAAAILDSSRSREADLIVMGTHGRRGVARAFLGSVAEEVIAQSDIPVLTVRCSGSPRKARFARILCPVNYSSSARRALAHATLLASAFEAELIILHLVESGDEDMMEELKRLRDWVGDVSLPVRARVLVHRGQAAGQVIDYAERYDVDLIVLGGQRKGGHTRSVLGSTTHRVTRHANCPVLTVPSDPFDHTPGAA